ncbi:Phage terminase large subunit [Clostridium neonatale]|uniref:terminase TerL endonuclease subunit n=1 Tax=Clostridium neonatale TaxID=137838 RepID=UPI001D3C483F|nr:terminase TerL endonuclease subunit [Clostridium neonatale]CAG9702613.1 Phage terminase large subunit [Clostridium neonatale]
MIKESKAYKYCLWCIKPNNKYVGKYIKLQAKRWLDICDGNTDYAYINEKMYKKISSLLKLIIHPDLRISCYDGLENYQWFFIIAILCTYRKDNNKRLYETGLLEISRKNFKTFTSAIIFILEMLLEPKFSRFFSVAPDYKLSCELKMAMKKIIKSSPAIEKYFKIKRDMTECKLKDSEYTPLAYSNDKMDGKLANVFLGDEAGAMDDYPIEAMRSSQITLKEKLGIIISTQYPNQNNVMITEIDMAKKILDGFLDDKTYFSLLYEPDEDIKKEWENNDLVIYQSNPVAVDNKDIFDSIVKKRSMAVLYESKRENYLCKHNNIQYIGIGVDGYVDSEQIRACRKKEEWNWKNKKVFVGSDGAESYDNSSHAMVGYDEETGIVHAMAYCFIQENNIELKCKKENFDYKKSIESRNTIVCGEDVLDYRQYENFIHDVFEQKYGAEIQQIGFDIRNLRNSAQRWEDEFGYETVEVKQHSSVLHPTIKWLKELILEKKFAFHNNLVYEANFCNCRQTEDTNLNKYINKKISVKTAGKVDMVFATINALYLLQQHLAEGENWVSQR